jgi:N-acetylmuramic acid 6-phosphate etherase
MECCGVDRDEARAAIAAAEGSVKLAIVMLVARVGKDEASRRLDEAAGFVRRAVGDPPRVHRG